MKYPGLQAVFLAGLLYLPQARATAIDGDVTGGDTVNSNNGVYLKLAPPLGNPNGTTNSVGSDNFNDYNLYLFDEEQNVLLESDLVVDDTGGVGRPFQEGTLPAGSTFSSHYLFFDPPGTATILVTGCVQFDSEVAAVISSSANLGASDYLANTGVNYEGTSLRGLESNDTYTFSGNEVCVEFRASTPGDYIRVITNFSPVAFEENALCTAIRTRGRRFGVYCF